MERVEFALQPFAIASSNGNSLESYATHPNGGDDLSQLKLVENRWLSIFHNCVSLVIAAVFEFKGLLTYLSSISMLGM